MSWRQTTPHYRRGGQWVSIGTGGGGGGGGSISTERFLTGDPPTRSGATITYDGGSHSSLQAAYDSLNEDETLYIDPSNSPYTERVRLRDNPVDHITIRSDQQLSFNEDGTFSVAQSGAELQQPDQNEEFILANGSGWQAEPDTSADTSLASSHSGGGTADQGNTSDVGDTTLDVNDASAFVGNEGEPIYILEEDVAYGEPDGSGGANHPGWTQEYNIIAGVDTNAHTIELAYPLYQPYDPASAPTTVGNISFTNRDVRISGLTLRADPSHSPDGDAGSRPLQIRGMMEPWIDNIRLFDSEGQHTSPHIASYRAHYENCHAADSRRYAYNCGRESYDAYFKNIYSTNHNRYTVRFGSAGSSDAGSSAGCAVDGIYGDNVIGRSVRGTHWGGFFVQTRDLRSTNSQVTAMRSRHLTLDGFEKEGGEDPEIVFAQRPAHCVVRNGTITNKPSDGNYVFRWRLRTSSETGRADEYFENITIENVHIDPYGSTTIDDIGHFEGSASGDGLHFRNVTYGDTQLTASHVRSWDGWGSANVSNLTVE